MPVSSLSNVPNILTSRATSFNFSQEEENRKNVALLNKDFYYGKQEQTLNLVSTEQDCVVINLIKPVVAKRAGLLYGTPVRVFTGPVESIKLIEQIYRDNKIDFLLQKADLSAELTGSAVIYPLLAEDLPSGIRLLLYDATQISPLQNEDDPTKLDALSIVKLVDRINPVRDTEVERVLKQQIWTPTSVLTYEGETLLTSENNELGFIPFANFKGEEVHDQWLGHAPATSVRMLNEDFNQILTDLGFMIKMQAGTPIALTGYQTGESLIIHPGRALALPAGTEAEVLNTNPQISETLETIKFLEEKMYESSGVPKVSVVGGGDATSGRELMIKWFPLVQFFSQKALRWQSYEQDLVNLLTDVLGLAPVEVEVKFSDNLVLPLTEAEDTLESDLSISLITPVDELMRRNPYLSEQEAENIVLSNAIFNDLIGLSVSPISDNMINSGTVDTSE